jgi:RNA polymerase sigma-70 factor (ECF subfamily)
VSTTPAESALEDAWRGEWGRLLALLVAQYRRLDLAEDGLADAFEAAARTWPADGVPANPPAWLLTAARRRIVDRLRSDQVLARRMPVLAVEADLREEAQRTMADAGEDIRDERLRLVLLCAHPALAAESGAARTRRRVIGLWTADIARLFLVPTPTMAARLTRARRRLAGESFAVPAPDELGERLGVAAEVAYLAFTAGYAPASGAAAVRPALAAEAIRLVRVLRAVAPGRPELDALLALELLQHSRRRSRAHDGALVVLAEQDRSRWDLDAIGEALELLTPLVHAPPSRWLLEALIASAHAVAPDAAATDWSRIADLYAELEGLTGSGVVRLNRAVAVAEADGPLAGLALLDGLELPGHRLPGTRAELLRRAGREAEAQVQFAAAIGLCDNELERRHLQGRAQAR